MLNLGEDKVHLNNALIHASQDCMHTAENTAHQAMTGRLPPRHATTESRLISPAPLHRGTDGAQFALGSQIDFAAPPEEDGREPLLATAVLRESIDDITMPKASLVTVVALAPHCDQAKTCREWPGKTVDVSFKNIKP
jgi:hypothetical protein